MGAVRPFREVLYHGTVCEVCRTDAAEKRILAGKKAENTIYYKFIKKHVGAC